MLKLQLDRGNSLKADLDLGVYHLAHIATVALSKAQGDEIQAHSASWSGGDIEIQFPSPDVMFIAIDGGAYHELNATDTRHLLNEASTLADLITACA